MTARFNETAEQAYDRMEREWEGLRAASHCEDCTHFWQMRADEQDLRGVTETVSQLCRKAPDVTRTWASVLQDVAIGVKLAVESHGYCDAYDFTPRADYGVGDCDDFSPLREVVA